MHLRREHLLALPLLVGLGVVADQVGAAPPPPPTASVDATADAWISQAPSHANHGADARLQVGGPGRGRSLVRFSTSDLLAAAGGRSLVSARLELTIAGTSNQWGHASHGQAARTVGAHRVTHARPWTETGATWDSPDDAGQHPQNRWDMRAHDEDDLPYDAEATATVAIAANQTGTISLDVTADVVAWLSTAAPNQGWLLRRQNEERGSGLLELRARQGTGAPRLVLTLGASAATSLVVVSGDGQQARPGERFAAPLVVAVRDAAGAGVVGRPVTFAMAAGAATLDGPSSATTDGAGLARVAVRLGATASGLIRITASAPGLSGSPRTFTLLALPPPTPVVAVADTFVERVRPNRAHGGESLLRVRPIGLSRALVRVDQAAIAAALAGGTLERAVLEVTLADVDVPDGCGPDRFVVAAHRLTQAWTEAGATWNSPADSNPSNGVRDGPRWSMRRPPFPFATTPTATTTLVDRQTGAATWDVTADVQAFLGGADNHGWLLKSARESGPGKADLRSRETATPPRLLLYVRDTTPPLLAFTSPAEGAVAGPTGLARLTFSDPSGLQPGSLVVRANGVDVTAAFAVAAGSAQAPLSALASSLDQGPNALSASIKDAWGIETTASRLFVFDAVGPALTLEPASGATVGSASVALRATYADAPAGVAPATFAASLDGAPITFSVGPAEATATSPPLAGGSHTLVVSIADLAGNVSTATSTFTVDTGGSLFGVVGGGLDLESLHSLAGVRVVALNDEHTETVTDALGRFTLTGLEGGPLVVIADGYAQGYGRTSLLVNVQGGVLTYADRPWILPVLPAGVPFTLDPAGRTTHDVVISNPDVPGASITIATGARMTLPSDGFTYPVGSTPTLALVKVSTVVLANALPALPDPTTALYAPYFYALQPDGFEVVEGGYDVVLPNDQGLPAGATSPLYVFNSSIGEYELETLLVVSPDGQRLTGHANSFGGQLAATTAGISISSLGQVGVSHTIIGSLGASSGGSGSVTPNPSAGSSANYTIQTGASPTQSVMTTLLTSTTPAATTFSLHTTPITGTTANAGAIVQITGIFPDAEKRSGTIASINVSLSTPATSALAVQSGRSAPLVVGPSGIPGSYLVTDPATITVAPGGFYFAEGRYDLVIGGSRRSAVIDTRGPSLSWSAITGGRSMDDGTPIAPTLSVTLTANDSVGVGPGDGAGLQFIEWTGDAQPRQENVLPGTTSGVWNSGPQVGTLTRTFSGASRYVVLSGRAGDTARSPTESGASTLGNVSSSLYRVAVDRDSPTVGASFDLGPTVRGTPVVVTYSASDGFDLDKVEVLIDGVPVDTTLLDGGEASFSRAYSLYREGDHRLSFRAYDEAGNPAAQTAERLYSFDSTAPTVTCTVQTLAVGPGGTPQIRIVATDAIAGAAQWTLERAPVAANGTIGAYVAVNSGTFTPVRGTRDFIVPDPTGPTEGRYSYRARVVDGSTPGNEGTGTSTTDLRVDATGATATFAPADGSFVGPGPVSILVTLDDLSGVVPASVRLTVDGALQVVTVQGPVDVSPLVRRTTVLATVQRLVEGNHEVRVEATDAAGNATSATSHVIQDHTPPSIDTFTPADGGPVTNAATVTWSATYSDAGAGVVPAGVTLSLRSGTGAPVNVTPAATVTATGATYTAALADGTHTLTLTVTDQTGAVSTDARTVTVDHTTPTLSITLAPPAAPAWSADALAPVVAVFTEAGPAGVAPDAVLAFLDGLPTPANVQLTATGGVVSVRRLAPLADGPHDVTIQVTDRAGNSVSRTTSFRIDATGPTAPGVPVAGARPLEPTTTIRWLAAADAGVGLAQYVVERTEDGQEWVEVGRTTDTFLVIPTPEGETTALRVAAIDAAGNRGPFATIQGGALTGLDDLSAPVQTRLVVTLQGAGAQTASVSERGTGTVLAHVGAGRYESGVVTVPAGTPLDLDVVVGGEPYTSGPLLPLPPAPSVTDFGTLPITARRLASTVVSAGGSSPAPSGAGLGFTLGEPFAAGPQSAPGGPTLEPGFWLPGLAAAARARLLQVPPVVCDRRWEPVFFEITGDAAATVQLTAELSFDGGATWAPMTVVGSLGPLSGTELGRRYVVLWDVGADLAAVSMADVVLRLYPAGQPALASTMTTTAFRAFGVTAVDPPAGTVDLDPSGPITLTFSRPVTTDGANLAAEIGLVDVRDDSSIAATVARSSDGRQVVVTPVAPIESATELRLVVRTGLRAAGDPAVFDQAPRSSVGQQPFETAYRIGRDDVAGPRVVSITPPPGATNVGNVLAIVVEFDEPLDPATVDARSVILLSDTSGARPIAVGLSPDGRSIVVGANLTHDTRYVLVIGSGVRDVAGNPLLPVVTTTFASATLHPPLPATPTLVLPANGTTITTFLGATPPLLGGTGPPNTVVVLFDGGLNTGISLPVDAAGNFSGVLPPISEGNRRLTLRAYDASGGISAASNENVVTVSTGLLRNPTPPTTGPALHEFVAGTTGHPYQQTTLTFTGLPPTTPVVLSATTRTAGFSVAGFIELAAGNGGSGPVEAEPGELRFTAVTDSSGRLSVTCGRYEAVGDQTTFAVFDAAGLTQLAAPKLATAVRPQAFGTLPTSPGADPLDPTFSCLARLFFDPSFSIIDLANSQALAVVEDENGAPAEAATINGQPGSAGVVLQLDANGNVQYDLRVAVGWQSLFRVSLYAIDAREPDGHQLHLGDSGYYDPVRPASLVSIAPEEWGVKEPHLNASYGCCTCKYGRPCPPPEGDEEAEAPTQPATKPEGKAVSLATGAEHLMRIDLAIPGRGGASFAFVRTYKSGIFYTGPLGERWSHNYDQRLVRRDAQGAQIDWVMGSGRADTFVRQPNGTYRSPTGHFDLLTFSGPDVATSTATIRFADGSRAVFTPFTGATSPGGSLAALRDRHGNALTLQYDVRGRVAAVVDPYGRIVSFAYDARGRLSTLTDFVGRRVKYEYGSHDDLIRVTSPIVTTTTENGPLLAEQQFPDGRTEIYGYTTGFKDERLNHLLRFQVAPVEAAQLKYATLAQLEDPAVLAPLACVEATWNTDATSFEFGRIVAERVGGASTLPAWTGVTTPVSAGGTTTFHYERLTPASPSLDAPVEKTTVVDRVGSLREYFHNAAGQVVRLREHANRNIRPRGTGPGEDPEYFERTWCHDASGRVIVVTHPMGGVDRWVHGDEDLNGDGLLTVGLDWNGDGDLDDPEDVRDEDDPRYAFRPGNGALDRLPDVSAANLLRAESVPDARGDTRTVGGRTPRVWTYAYEPVFNQLRAVTDPRGNDPTYTPQNGGVTSPARYTSTLYFDYQQSLDLTATLNALAAELGTTPADVQARLTAAGVALQQGDLNGSAADDQFRRGDVVRSVAPEVQLVAEQTYLQGVLGSSRQAIQGTAEFNQFGQPIRTVDAERNVHVVEYYPSDDPDGDGVRVTGVPAGLPTGGYPKAARADVASDPLRDSRTNPTPVNLLSRVFYDDVGNPTRTIDPRGVEHQVEFNPLNEVVRARAATAIVGPLQAEPTGAIVALDYEAYVIHDANGRVVETRAENAGERDGTSLRVTTNPFWSRKVAYDLLGAPVLTLAEVEPIADDGSITIDSPGVITGSVTYDAASRPVVVTKPEGNSVGYVYDERGHVFQVIDGLGSDDAATFTAHYNANGNPLYTVDAVKHNKSRWPEFPTGDVVRTKYDGFDEVTCATDPEGNCGDAVFDPCGRRVRFVKFATAEPGVPRLAEVEHFYDELGRPFRVDARVFEDGGSFSSATWNRAMPTVNDPAPVGELEATSITEYDALGRTVRGRDPKLDDSFAEYDGLGRLTRARGPAFAAVSGGASVRNEVRPVYNLAGQPVTVTTVDSTPLGPAQSFSSYAAYDALGRLVEATDSVGQTSRRVYDSRSLPIAASDARSSVMGMPSGTLYPGTVNGHGNVVHAFFDGLGRPVKSELLMKTGGQGNGQLDLVGAPTGLDLTNPANADGKITIRQSYDRSSRLVSRQDDNGNTTTYAYDAQDRGTYVVGADLTVQRSVYDADSNVVETIDRNGTTIAYTHDGDHRVVKAEVTRRATNLEGTGQGVEGTAVMAWEYDGLSRPRVCVDQNDPSDPADDVATSYTFDSLSRPLTERHRFRASTSVNAVFTQSGRIGVGSAGIDKTIARTFDLDSNRTSTTYSSGRAISYGLDGADRIQQIVEGALGAGPAIQTTEWLGGRPLRSDAGNGVRTQYGYDADRRLTSLAHVGALGAGTNVASFVHTWTRGNQRASETFTAAGLPGATQTYSYDSASRLVRVAFAGGAAPRPDTTWLIDGVGNQVKKEEDGQTTALNVRANGRYLPDLMNEVATFTRFDAMASVLGEERHVQDPNGSRIKDGQFKLYFDAFERLVRVERASDGVVVGRYRYDAAGRRADRQFRVGGGPLQQVFHVHDGAQEVEELDGAGAVQADFVWGGLYVDQLVQMRRGGGTYYAHQNSVFSVVALTDASGAVAERYGYSSVYGECQVQSPDGSSRSSASEVGNPWRFQGRRFDQETGWLFFRARLLDPMAGRWVSRDPLGIWGDPGQVGNAYSFCGNDPVNRLDPMGLDDTPGGTRVTTKPCPHKRDKALNFTEWNRERASSPDASWLDKFYGLSVTPPTGSIDPYEIIPLYGSYYLLGKMRDAYAKYQADPTEANREDYFAITLRFQLAALGDITLIGGFFVGLFQNALTRAATGTLNTIARGGRYTIGLAADTGAALQAGITVGEGAGTTVRTLWAPSGQCIPTFLGTFQEARALRMLVRDAEQIYLAEVQAAQAAGLPAKLVGKEAGSQAASRIVARGQALGLTIVPEEQTFRLTPGIVKIEGDASTAARRFGDLVLPEQRIVLELTTEPTGNFLNLSVRKQGQIQDYYLGGFWPIIISPR